MGEYILKCDCGYELEVEPPKAVECPVCGRRYIYKYRIRKYIRA